MHLISSPAFLIPATAMSALIFGMGSVQAQVSAHAAIVGQWTFETVIGTSNEQDVIGKGVMKIIPKPGDNAQALRADIVWLDDQGQAISKREMDGKLQGTQAVFSHLSQRVVNSGGKSQTTDVKVVWILSVSGNTLSGSRALADDDDEPKPVSGQRDTARSMPELKPLPKLATNDDERGPSTAEERARVLGLAVAAAKNPGAVSALERAWLRDWVKAIPDLDFNPGSTGDWLRTALKSPLRELLQFQFMASVMAFQIQNPALEKNQKAIEQAGLEGVLQAYEVCLTANPGIQSTELNAAMAARAQGRLAEFVVRLAGRDTDRNLPVSQ